MDCSCSILATLWLLGPGQLFTFAFLSSLTAPKIREVSPMSWTFLIVMVQWFEENLTSFIVIAKTSRNYHCLCQSSPKYYVPYILQQTLPSRFFHCHANKLGHDGFSSRESQPCILLSLRVLRLVTLLLFIDSLQHSAPVTLFSHELPLWIKAPWLMQRLSVPSAVSVWHHIKTALKKYSYWIHADASWRPHIGNQVSHD